MAQRRGAPCGCPGQASRVPRDPYNAREIGVRLDIWAFVFSPSFVAVCNAKYPYVKPDPVVTSVLSEET